MMPSWTKCLQVLVLLAIIGYTLVIVSGFWQVLALLIILTVIGWFWRNTRSRRR